jgi:hypothetical protein
MTKGENMITWIPLENIKKQKLNNLPPDVQDVFVYYQILEDEIDKIEPRYQISVGYFNFSTNTWRLSTGTDIGDVEITVTHWAPLTKGMLPNKLNTMNLFSQKERLEQGIEKLELPQYVFYCLRRNGIFLICDLIEYSKMELLKMDDMSVCFVNDITNKLEKIGLSLKKE